jgi:hypothetical protein
MTPNAPTRQSGVRVRRTTVRLRKGQAYAFRAGGCGCTPDRENEYISLSYGHLRQTYAPPPTRTPDPCPDRPAGVRRTPAPTVRLTVRLTPDEAAGLSSARSPSPRPRPREACFAADRGACGFYFLGARVRVHAARPEPRASSPPAHARDAAGEAGIEREVGGRPCRGGAAALVGSFPPIVSGRQPGEQPITRLSDPTF